MMYIIPFYPRAGARTQRGSEGVSGKTQNSEIDQKQEFDQLNHSAQNVSLKSKSTYIFMHMYCIFFTFFTTF